MGLKSFVYYLDTALENRIREEIMIEKGKVIKFVVQYEAFISEDWRPIARYDTFHGFAHLDLYETHRQKKKLKLAVNDFNEALTYAENDLKKNWMKYLKNYLQHFANRRKNE